MTVWRNKSEKRIFFIETSHYFFEVLFFRCPAVKVVNGLSNEICMYSRIKINDRQSQSKTSERCPNSQTEKSGCRAHAGKEFIPRTVIIHHDVVLVERQSTYSYVCKVNTNYSYVGTYIRREYYGTTVQYINNY